MGSSKYDTFDVPGVGEFQAREGTSTHELAGAVKFWHDKSKTAWIDGFSAGAIITAIASITFGAIFYYLRSH